MTIGYSYGASAPNLVASCMLWAGMQAQRHTHTHRDANLSVGRLFEIEPWDPVHCFKRGTGMFSHVKHTKQKNPSVKFTHKLVHLEKVPNKKRKKEKHYQFFLPI